MHEVVEEVVFMKAFLKNRILFATCSAMLLTYATPTLAARYALMIGNDAYEDVTPLENAGADANAMAEALQKAGYVTTLVRNRTLKQMKDDVREFRSHVNGGDEVVFYYSGHGVQIEAMNYLLPIDVRADSEDQVKDDALPLSKVLEDIRDRKPSLTLAVVDACRDNPFKGKGRAIGGRGLTGVTGATGQMVIYSAGEGQQALDRLSDDDPVKNGLFTRVFIKEMEKPGVPIDRVARKVREEVNNMALSVNHQQVPAIYDQVIGQFYFYDKVKTPSVQAKAAGPDSVEIIFWKSVKDSRDAGELNAYLEKYPQGQFAGLAKARIASLQNAAQASIQPAAKPAQESDKPEAVKSIAAESAPAVPVKSEDKPAAAASDAGVVDGGDLENAAANAMSEPDQSVAH